MENSCNSVLFNDTFKSEKEKRRDIIHSIIGTITNSGYPVRYDDSTLELMIDEAVTNAMEHGNAWDPSRKVNVSLFEDDRNLCLSIMDEGSGFDFQSRDSAYPHLKLRGRGLQILSSLTEISWNESGNCITMKLTSD